MSRSPVATCEKVLPRHRGGRSDGVRLLAARGRLGLGRRLAFLAAMLAGFADASSAGEHAALDALVRAYPDFLAGYDATDLIWRDGTPMPLPERRPTVDVADMLRHVSILDQIRQPYPVGPLPLEMAPTGDPGRVRN